MCGALQNPKKMTALLGRSAPFAPAAAAGYERTVEVICDQPIPLMAPSADPSRVLTGVVWFGLTDADLAAIETLELDGGHRQRVNIRVEVGTRSIEAFTYVRKGA